MYPQRHLLSVELKTMMQGTTGAAPVVLSDTTIESEPAHRRARASCRDTLAHGASWQRHRSTARRRVITLALGARRWARRAPAERMVLPNASNGVTSTAPGGVASADEENKPSPASALLCSEGASTD